MRARAMVDADEPMRHAPLWQSDPAKQSTRALADAAGDSQDLLGRADEVLQQFDV